jgi:hypothetical protein
MLDSSADSSGKVGGRVQMYSWIDRRRDHSIPIYHLEDPFSTREVLDAYLACASRLRQVNSLIFIGESGRKGCDEPNNES